MATQSILKLDLTALNLIVISTALPSHQRQIASVKHLKQQNTFYLIVFYTQMKEMSFFTKLGGVLEKKSVDN